MFENVDAKLFIHIGQPQAMPTIADYVGVCSECTTMPAYKVQMSV